MKRIAVFLALCLPFVALAQEAAAPALAAPSSIANLLASFLTPTGLVFGLGLISTILTLFVVKAEVWKRRLAKVFKHGFEVVEDLTAEGVPGLDKTAAYLKAMNDFCLANKGRTLTPAEQELAKLEAKAMNVAAEAGEAIRTKALIAAAPVTAQATAELIAGLK